MVIAFRGRTEKATGGYTVSSTALIALFAGLCLFMVCVVFSAATVAASGRLDRRMHRLWTGRVGKLLYRVATWRLDEPAVATASAPGSRGALTLLDALPGETRRRLGKTRVLLERLEGELERLERRDAELEAAATEARVNAPSLPGGSGDRQRALQEDLDRARQQTGERRLAVLGALENVRLALVRVKSRIGTPEDVERELADAEALLGASRG
jgi:hypothetical protein